MNTFTKIVTASAFLLAIAAPASAIVSPEIGKDIRAAAGGNSSISVRVNGESVTVYGVVTDGTAIQKIEQAALDNGAESVNNYVRHFVK